MEDVPTINKSDVWGCFGYGIRQRSPHRCAVEHGEKLSGQITKLFVQILKTLDYIDA